jgi:hypothetical protein
MMFSRRMGLEWNGKSGQNGIEWKEWDKVDRMESSWKKVMCNSFDVCMLLN